MLPTYWQRDVTCQPVTVDFPMACYSIKFLRATYLGLLEYRQLQLRVDRSWENVLQRQLPLVRSTTNLLLHRIRQFVLRFYPFDVFASFYLSLLSLVLPDPKYNSYPNYRLYLSRYLVL